MFGNIFDASVQFGDHESMTLLHPSELRVGDIVVVEAIVARTNLLGGYKVSYLALTIARLLAAPEGPIAYHPDDVLDVPRRRFTRRL